MALNASGLSRHVHLAGPRQECGLSRVSGYQVKHRRHRLRAVQIPMVAKETADPRHCLVPEQRLDNDRVTGIGRKDGWQEVDHAVWVQGNGVRKNLLDNGQPAGRPRGRGGTQKAGRVDAPRHPGFSRLRANTDSHQGSGGRKILQAGWRHPQKVTLAE